MARSSAKLPAVAALLALAVAISPAAERKFEKKFSVKPAGTLTLSTDIGSVTVIGTSSNEVAVVADMEGRARDLEDFEISAQETPNGIEVKGKGRKGGWFWSWDDIDVHFTVHVPREYSLLLNTSGGNIFVSNVKGKTNGETSGGDIRVEGSEGEVDLGTSGGNIIVESVVGNVNMETSGGDIRITDVTGLVAVSTSGGSIKLSGVDGKVRAETSGGDIVVKLKGGNKGVFAETSGGNIDIMVGKAVAANIDASTSGGEVVCDLPITMSGKIDESRIRGTVNGGGETIHAHTSGGDVRIRALD
jgi:hypothetical protein